MGQNVKILVPVQIMLETKLQMHCLINLVDDHAMAGIIMIILIILTKTVTIMNMTVTMLMIMVTNMMVTEQPGQWHKTS